jgi:hypothetical protein
LENTFLTPFKGLEIIFIVGDKGDRIEKGGEESFKKEAENY